MTIDAYRRRTARLFAGAALPVLAVGVAASAAQAQTAPAAPPPATSSAPRQGGLQDIVVTARRVQERLQNVPLSVTAFSSAKLADAQITQVRDIKNLVSNVNTVHTSTPGNSYIAIRGLTSGTLPTVSLDNRAGIYLDGVYIARAQGGSFTLADIDRVEVLKGPQGTLFGHNSTAGAVSFTTTNPTGKFDAIAEAGFGNFGRQRYRLSFDLPEWQGFSVHFGYVHDHDDGDIKNLAGGRTYGAFVNTAAGYDIPIGKSEKREGGFNNNSIFAAVRYDGITNLTIDYKFDYSRDIEYPTTGQTLGYAPNFVGCSGAVLALGLQYNCATASSSGLDTTAAPITAAGANHVPISFTKQHDLYADLTNPNRIVNWGHSLTINYVASDALTLRSITGYRGVRTKDVQDLDGGDIYVINAVYNGAAAFLGGTPTPDTPSGLTPFCGECAVVTQKQHQFSEEFQAIAHVGRFDLLGGLYYFHERGRENNFFISNFNPYSALVGFGLPPLQQDVNDVPAFGFSNGNLALAKATSRAAFGRITWHATDKLDLVAGGRYTQDRKSGDINPVAQQFVFDPDNPGQLIPLHNRVGFNRFTYEGTATYKFTPDVNVFARYTTAYLAGGLMRNVPYKPETAKDVEIGLKSEWFDRHLRFNLTGFSQKSSNLQVATNAPPYGTLIVENIGSVKTKGFEAELTVAPVNGLTLSTNVGYAHQHYSNGSRNLAPVWTLNLSSTYNTPKFDNGMFLELEADGNYSSRYNSNQYPIDDAAHGNTDGTPLPPQVWAGYGSEAAYLQALDKATFAGGYWVANARVSLTDIPLGGTKARISGYVKNLFNTQHLSFSQNYGLQVLGVFEQDRRFGVDLRVQF